MKYLRNSTNSRNFAIDCGESMKSQSVILTLIIQ